MVAIVGGKTAITLVKKVKKILKVLYFNKRVDRINLYKLLIYVVYSSLIFFNEEWKLIVLGIVPGCLVSLWWSSPAPETPGPVINNINTNNINNNSNNINKVDRVLEFQRPQVLSSTTSKTSTSTSTTSTTLRSTSTATTSTK